MKKPSRVEIELLGRRFTLRSEVSPEYLKTLVAHVERTIREVGGEGNEDPLKIALVTALYITDELFRAREAQSQETEKVAQRVGELIELLDTVAPERPLSS
ncbi:MAG: cell division protein ZapA [Candidatus Methylomirabilia bacterium]